MTTLGAFEAKTHLASLLDRVARGEQITITKHGMAVARLVPVTTTSPAQSREIIEKIKASRKGHGLKGLKLKTLVAQGRR
ncbi:MAG: type II toxin-antitoxin system Phd/YefM family antitoxin [Myxococcales bacterium]